MGMSSRPAAVTTVSTIPVLGPWEAPRATGDAEAVTKVGALSGSSTGLPEAPAFVF